MSTSYNESPESCWPIWSRRKCHHRLPCDGLLRRIIPLFPDSFVILSVRDSDTQWWKSFYESFGVFFDGTLQSFLLQALILPVWDIYRTKKMVGAYIAGWKSRYGCYASDIHRIHNARVQKQIPSDRLLVYNVKQEWDPLCKLLGVPVPNKPFPRMYVGS